RELAPPRLAPHLLRRHEVVEIDRLVLGPDAARRAEVGDARFSRHARAGEGDHTPGALDHLTQPVDLAHGFTPLSVVPSVAEGPSLHEQAAYSGEKIPRLHRPPGGSARDTGRFHLP